MKVVVYSRPNCLQSKKLKRYLTKRGITFVDKDITKSENMDELYELIGYEPRMPVISIDGDVYVYDEELFDLLDMLIS